MNRLRVFNSKINSAFTCETKLKLGYVEGWTSKTPSLPMKIGSLTHDAIKHHFDFRKEGFQGDEALAMTLQKMKQLTDSEEEYLQASRLVGPLLENEMYASLECVEAEQTHVFQYDNWEWCIRPDCLLKDHKTGLTWLGEIKTSKGYGPGLQRIFHREMQPWTYLAALSRNTDIKFAGIMMLIVTKTKVVQTFAEPIPILDIRLQQAWDYFHEGMDIIRRCEQTGHYSHNRSACTSLRGDCDFISVCDYPDNTEYSQNVLESLFTKYNPEDHLHLEQARVWPEGK